MLEPSIRLRQAITEGNLLVVKRLLKRFPDLLENVDPSNGWSSLHYAAYHGRYLVCVHLISLGHDRNETLHTFKHNSSVHLALSNGHEQTTHLLLQHFPDQLNEHGESGQTPLHVSSIKDYFKCVEMLLGLGADINALDSEGNNALHIAMKYGALRTIRLLVQHNINTALKNNNGLIPLDVAASFQVERQYHSIISDSASSTDIEDISALNIGSNSLKNLSSSSTALSETQATGLQEHRSHSNSLPPLPSVTTTRRASNASSTRSPIPRSAISLGFTGTNSYIYSPVQPTSGSGLGTLNSPLSLSIKPPSMISSSSPVLYSPTGNGAMIPSIREEHQASSLLHSHSLHSFPSMSSLNSGKNTPTDGRTRASSNITGSGGSGAVGVSFTPLHKSRSNSHGSKSSSIRLTKSNANEGPGRISPADSSLSLSRSPSESFEDQISTESLKAHSSNGNAGVINASTLGTVSTPNTSTGLMSNFSEGSDNDMRLKYTEKFENVSSEYGKRGSSKGSILNIPIASMGRSRKE